MAEIQILLCKNFVPKKSRKEGTCLIEAGNQSVYVHSAPSGFPTAESAFTPREIAPAVLVKCKKAATQDAGWLCGSV